MDGYGYLGQSGNLGHNVWNILELGKNSFLIGTILDLVEKIR